MFVKASFRIKKVSQSWRRKVNNSFNYNNKGLNEGPLRSITKVLSES